MCGIVTQFSMRFPYVAAVVRESGATTLLLQPLSGDRRESIRFVEELCGMLP